MKLVHYVSVALSSFNAGSNRRRNQGGPRLPRTFGPGTLVVMFCRTSRDVPSCLRTSWNFCSGIVRKVRGSPGHVSEKQNYIVKGKFKFQLIN